MSDRVFFPKEMRDASRWLVRRAFAGSDNKQPCSPLAECPDGYKPTPGEKETSWRWRWQQRCIQVTLADAIEYLKANRKECEGLSFVVHPGNEVEKQPRIIAVDFDDAFDADGKPWSWIQDILDVADSFVEYSRSGDGLHLFIRTDCLPFTNLTHHVHPDGGAIEILCNSQVAVTGRPYGTPCEISDVPFSFVEKLPFFQNRETLTTDADLNFHQEWWDKVFEGLSDDARSLTETMSNWEEAIRAPEHPCDSHKILITAACWLARRGIVGNAAVELMRLMPVDRPWSEGELKHKAEEAWKITNGDGTFDTIALASADGSEFGDLTADELQIETELKLFDKPKLFDAPAEAYQWFTCDELLSSPPVNYLIPDILAEMLPCVFGGAEKTLKTSLMVDMAISLATATPFLSRFPVTAAVKVVCISAESGRGSLRSILERVCAAREIDPKIDNLIWSEMPPNLGDMSSMLDLKANLIKHEIKVLMIDPAYLTLPGDGAENVFKVGPLLRLLGDLCKSLGVTMLMAHHTNRKPVGEKFSLRDLSYAGFAEFFRQWVGLRRLSDWTEGISVLQMDVGSSAGHGDSWNVTVDEGVRDGLVDDRRWSVTVCKAVDLPNEDEQRILGLVDDGLTPENQLLLLADPIPTKKAKKILAKLCKTGQIVFQNGSYKKGTPLDVTESDKIFTGPSDALQEFLGEATEAQDPTQFISDFGFD